MNAFENLTTTSYMATTGVHGVVMNICLAKAVFPTRATSAVNLFIASVHSANGLRQLEDSAHDRALRPLRRSGCSQSLGSVFSYKLWVPHHQKLPVVSRFAALAQVTLTLHLQTSPQKD